MYIHFCNHQKRVFAIHMVRASVFFTGGKHIKRTQHINKTIVEKEKKNSNAFHSSCVASGILMTEDCGVLSFCLSLHMGCLVVVALVLHLLKQWVYVTLLTIRLVLSTLGLVLQQLFSHPVYTNSWHFWLCTVDSIHFTSGGSCNTLQVTMKWLVSCEMGLILTKYPLPVLLLKAIWCHSFIGVIQKRITQLLSV